MLGRTGAKDIISNPTKVGLVLAGGGAKGAYHIGAWEAFSEAGLRFSAFSGTSIGALNAAILSTTGGSTARAFWEQLSTSTMAQFSKWALPALVVTMMGHIQNSTGSSYRKPVRYTWWLICLNVICSLFVIYGVLSTAKYYGFLGSSLIALFVISIFCGRYLFDYLNLPLAKNKVLDDLIARAPIDWDLLAGSDRPFFATTVTERLVYDPLAIRFLDMFRATAPFEPKEKRKYFRRVVASLDLPLERVSRYIRLNGNTPEAAQKAIAASMALPFGLFRRVRFRRRRYVDGGLVDNVPIFPFLDLGLNAIIVVHCNPRPFGFRSAEWMDGKLELATIENRLLRIQMQQDGLRSTEHGAPERLTVRERLDGCDILQIYPSGRLGLPIVGTLFFSKRKSEQLFLRGYQDTKAALERRGYASSSSRE